MLSSFCDDASPWSYCREPHNTPDFINSLHFCTDQKDKAYILNSDGNGPDKCFFSLNSAKSSASTQSSDKDLSAFFKMSRIHVLTVEQSFLVIVAKQLIGL